MMKFRQVKQAIESLLYSFAYNRFIVIGAQNQSTGANELINKYIRVFYRSGSFPKTQSSSYSRIIKHNMQIDVELSVAAKAVCDLSILNNPASTEGERSAALLASNDASIIADNILDELFEDVFQIIMSPKNYDIGFKQHSISDRWINDFRKDDPLPQGENVILTGMFQIVCSADENIDSETGSPALTQSAIINDIAGVSGNLGGV